jgi:hypothetical protein
MFAKYINQLGNFVSSDRCEVQVFIAEQGCCCGLERRYPQARSVLLDKEIKKTIWLS